MKSFSLIAKIMNGANIGLLFNIPYNNFSVMLGQSNYFLGNSLVLQRIKCLAQGSMILNPKTLGLYTDTQPLRHPASQS